jgi:hypothetical protein
MFDRVIYLGALIRISLPGDEDDPATRDEVNEINEKLDSYEHMCGFRWSPSFNAVRLTNDGWTDYTHRRCRIPALLMVRCLN